MINSISSGSNYWYQQTKNSAVKQLIAAATNKEATISQVDTDETSEVSDLKKKRLSMEDLMGMLQSNSKSTSVTAEEEETKEESGISAVDADGDGSLSVDEYESMISQLGIQNALSAEEFFAHYDTDNDGEISSDEINAQDTNKPMMPPPLPPMKEEEALPSDIDTDGDGSLSADEYAAMLSQLGVQDALSSDDFFSLYDTNEDGEISADEIAAMKDSTTQNLAAENKKIANSTMRAYETNYQYMFDEEDSYLNSIA